MDQTPVVRGQRLLPSLVDEIAQNDPTRILYSFSKTTDPVEGFHDVDAQVFARAVNRCARYIEQEIGIGIDFPTMTYMGPQDLVYAILVLACIKTGYKLLLSSPRNTLDAHLSLFEQTECHTFLMPPKFPLPVVQQILKSRNMRVLEIPSVLHWLEEGDIEPYAYNKTYAAAKGEPFVILHTSGSTGLPKPIIQTHGTLSPLDTFCDLLSLGYKPTYPAMCAGSRVYLTFPLFHCAGLSMLLPGSIYSGFTIVLGPFPPSADVANGMHLHANVQHSCLAPMTLIELAKDREHLENLSKLEQVTFGGGPCPQAVGDLISKQTRLLNCLGTTEAGILAIQLCDPEDWAYMSISPALGGVYRHVSEDLYEHSIVRKESSRHFQGIFETFPSLQEWPMKDLYSKHPTKENVWMYQGRTDDIIVFSTGEKVNPIGMESIIGAHPRVRGAIVAGLGKIQSSLLLELVDPPGKDADIQRALDELWPAIEAANKQSPSHSRIHRNMVIFTSADKPMPRAGKGTIQRKLAVELYQADLDRIYALNESDSATQPGSDTRADETALERVQRIITTTTDIDARSIAPDANLFDVGLDSLQAMILAKELNSYLQGHAKPQSVSPRNIYANPTIGCLTDYVVALFDDQALPADIKTDEDRMRATYNELQSWLPISGRPPLEIPDRHAVLLTGSTGSLGAYILNSLLENSHVATVYCFVRGESISTIKGRQGEIHTANNFSTDISRVRFLNADLTLPFFGLNWFEYGEMFQSVTMVIHSAWQVDFNMNFDSFRPHIQIVRHFIDFSALSRYAAPIVFVSSVSAVSSFNVQDSSTGIPEDIFQDWNVYTASQEAGVPAIICRAGQIAGPTTKAGVWPKKEWLPSLIASSKHLGKLFESLGRMDAIDWIPVDTLAHELVRLVTESVVIEPSRTARVFHFANPQLTSWSALLPVVQSRLASSAGTPIEVVPLEKWLDALRQSACKVENASQNPATKILDFFGGLVSDTSRPLTLSTENTVKVLPSLAEMGPVSTAWMENWLEQWRF